MNNDKIGRLIARMRKDKDLTQQDLAERLNVSNKTISRWETGDTLPDAGLILDLAEELGITSDELLRGELAETSSDQQALKKPAHKINLSLILGWALFLISVLITFFGLWPDSWPARVIITLVLASAMTLFGHYQLEGTVSQLRTLQTSLVFSVTAITYFITYYLSFLLLVHYNILGPMMLGRLWLGLSLLLGLAVAWLAGRRYHAKPFPWRLSGVMLLITILGLGLIHFLIPTHQVEVSDPFYWPIVERDHREFQAGRTVSNAPIAIAYTDKAWLLQDYLTPYTSGATPGQDFKLVVDHSRVTKLREPNRIYFRDPIQTNNWYMNYLFLASLFMSIVYLWKSGH